MNLTTITKNQISYIKISFQLILAQKENDERKRFFKSMSSLERKKLIRSKMKAIGLKEGSGVPNKKYKDDEIKDLIKIINCFPEMRNKKINRNK